VVKERQGMLESNKLSGTQTATPTPRTSSSGEVEPLSFTFVSSSASDIKSEDDQKKLLNDANLRQIKEEVRRRMALARGPNSSTRPGSGSLNGIKNSDTRTSAVFNRLGWQNVYARVVQSGEQASKEAENKEAADRNSKGGEEKKG